MDHTLQAVKEAEQRLEALLNGYGVGVPQNLINFRDSLDKLVPSSLLNGLNQRINNYNNAHGPQNIIACTEELLSYYHQNEESLSHLGAVADDMRYLTNQVERMRQARALVDELKDQSLTKDEALAKAQEVKRLYGIMGVNSASLDAFIRKVEAMTDPQVVRDFNSRVEAWNKDQSPANGQELINYYNAHVQDLSNTDAQATIDKVQTKLDMITSLGQAFRELNDLWAQVEDEY